MKKWLLSVLFCTLSASGSASAHESKLDLTAFAQQYFDTLVATQAPDATAKELEKYLALLTDDVGSSHIPYQVDASRQSDGKQSMRKGMTFYLGAHKEYNSKLLNVFTFNETAIAIRYHNSAKGIHPQTQEPHAYSSIMMEVLEIEDGKVAVIRKYHE
jgi:hypothetical protein